MSIATRHHDEPAHRSERTEKTRSNLAHAYWTLHGDVEEQEKQLSEYLRAATTRHESRMSRAIEDERVRAQMVTTRVGFYLIVTGYSVLTAVSVLLIIAANNDDATSATLVGVFAALVTAVSGIAFGVAVRSLVVSRRRRRDELWKYLHEAERGFIERYRLRAEGD